MGLVQDIARSMRPQQWTKNLLVFAAILFAGKAADAEAVGEVLVGFAAFCLLSGATYLLNNSLDAAQDRQHPEKCDRPIAAGRIPVHEGLLLAVFFGLWAS